MFSLTVQAFKGLVFLRIYIGSYIKKKNNNNSTNHLYPRKGIYINIKVERDEKHLGEKYMR